MWQIHAQMALDLARERAAESRARAMADEARAMAAEERRRHAVATTPSRPRMAAAAVLRGISGALSGVSEAACDAAARLERRTA